MYQQIYLVRLTGGRGIRKVKAKGSGVFQRLMANAFPEIDVLDVGRLLLNYVLSDPYMDVALVGVREARGHGACHSESRFVDLNNEISDDVASCIDLAALRDQYVRQQVISKALQFTVVGTNLPETHKHRARPLIDSQEEVEYTVIESISDV